MGLAPLPGTVTASAASRYDERQVNDIGDFVNDVLARYVVIPFVCHRFLVVRRRGVSPRWTLLVMHVTYYHSFPRNTSVAFVDNPIETGLWVIQCPPAYAVVHTTTHVPNNTKRCLLQLFYALLSPSPSPLL